MRTTEQAVAHAFWRAEAIDVVLRAYCQGIPVLDICDLVGLRPSEVNGIIDRYADLFLGEE